MITEDYVSFETAKLLKENGFDEDVNLWYNENGNEMFFQQKYDIMYNWRVRQGLEIYQCPTLQMVMKWLREEKDILISVNPTLDKDGFACVMYYIWDIDDIETKAITSGLYSLEGYNECIEAAIKYCLENLI